MVLLRWLSSWFLVSKRNIQVHQKDTLDLFIHSSCLKALNDGGCLRLSQALSREFKVKSTPMTSFTHPPPMTWRPLSNPWRVSSVDNKTIQDSKPPMFFLTAVTRKLAIASFLCGYSGPFWGMFSKIRLDIYIYYYYHFLSFLIGQERSHRANGQSTTFVPRIKVSYTEANCSVFAEAGS